MDVLLPICSGGVVEFLAYHVDGLNWRRISIHCSLSQPDLILLLCILSIALFVFAVFILSDLCIFPRRKFASPVSSEDDDLHQRMSLMGDLVKPIHRSFLVHVWTYLKSKETMITSTSVADTSIMLESLRPLKLSIDEDGTNKSPVPLSVPCWNYPINVFCIGVAVSVIVALIVGTIYTCFLAQQIEHTLIGLTGHIEDVSQSLKDLSNGFINDSYSIMNRVIKEDVAQSNHLSNLRPFIEDMKLIWGDEAMRLYAMALNITPNKQWLRENTRSNLLHFNTFLRRLSSLFSVAPFLSEANVKAVNDIYLSYTHELVRLTPHPLFKPASWKDIQILNFTYVALCEHSTSVFPTCADVQSYLKMIVDKLEAWPSYVKSRDFTKVTAFTLLPRMLNAEAHVERWVPLAQDPTGNIPFLFDEFLIPEIDKDIARLNRSLDNLPKLWAESSVRKYLSVVSVFPVVLAIILSILFLLSVMAVLISSNCCFCCCLTRPNRLVKDKVGSKMSTCYRHSFAIVTICLCIFGAVCGTVGSIGQNQLCDVLFVRAQSADIWLDQMLAKILPGVDDLREVLEIQNIQFRFPERVFSTLDSNYTSQSLPLLQAVHMNRPVNLTAFWHSHWLNKTLYDLWYKDVWPLMEQANMSYQIPRVPLSKTFSQFRTAVKLDQTFDDLYVGNITEYLPAPAEDYYTKIGLALKAASNCGSKEVNQLATYFTTIGNLISLYKLKFDQMAQALNVIEQNKVILKPLSPLIDVGDKIISYLANKTNPELIAQFTNNTSEIYINSNSSVEQYVIPIFHRILDQLFPYPHLREAYRKAFSPICPTEFPHSALFLNLRSFGFTLSLSAFGLFIVSVGYNWVLPKPRRSAT